MQTIFLPAIVCIMIKLANRKEETECEKGEQNRALVWLDAHRTMHIYMANAGESILCWAIACNCILAL